MNWNYYALTNFFFNNYYVTINNFDDFKINIFLIFIIFLIFHKIIYHLNYLQSWEAVDRSSSNFTPDITPLILAAHKNNYEIIKILLDRGATLPTPHDARCGCDECVLSSETDSLRHSQSRINAYRALSSSSLIALSSRDPLLTAFELSWELRRLSHMEQEFKAEYIVCSWKFNFSK